MSKPTFASLSILTAATAFVTLASTRLAGQAPQSTSTTAAVETTKKWTPPRTAWGEPDISGNFTNVYEQATPLERPDELVARGRNDIKGEELAKLLGTRRDRQLQNFDAGSDVHAPTFWWADSLAVERGSYPWFIVDPPDGKIPQMTAEAQQRLAAARDARARSGRGAADSYEDRSLYDRCITRGLPGSMMPAIYGNSYRIVQGPGWVGIQYEMVHETRIIPIEAQPSPHVGMDIRMDMGDARGHWEGDTLVVETTNFKQRSAYRNANADTLRLIERFRRIAPNKVQWAVTVDDPKTWARQWTFSMPLTEDNQEAIFEYACHEGNLGLRNILSGARADEKDIEEAARRGITLAPRAVPTGAEGER